MATSEGNSPGDDDHAEYEDEDDGRLEGGAAAKAELLDISGGRSGDDANGSSTQGTVFVGGVRWETTEETFSKHFKKYGEILDSVIKRDKHTQNPRGFGFVTFADPSVVEAVLKVEHVIDGKTVEVKRAVRRNSPTLPSKVGSKTNNICVGRLPNKIFVGGLPPHLSEAEFKDHFTFYGTVVEHAIMFDLSTGHSRGFGFITFEDEKVVDAIMAEGKIHEFGGKQVQVNRAMPKISAIDTKAGMAADPVSVPVGGGVYGSYGGGALGYGGGHGYGGVAGDYGRGYGYAAGYGYGGGAAGYGAGSGAGAESGYGHGVFGGMGQSGAGAESGYGHGVFRGMGQSGAGAESGYGHGVFRGMGQSGGRYHPYGK